jgi:hypothetical protein
MHWLAYGYEVIGGILIFISSAVTETQLPAPERRKHWIVFGIVAVMYIGFGLGLRYMEVRQSEADRAETVQARKDVREARQDVRDVRSTLDDRMSSVLSAFQVAYAQIASLSSDLSGMRTSLMQTIHKNDPRQVADLQSKAQAAQTQADNLQRELLAMTMTPQVAEQLRGWQLAYSVKQQDLHLHEDEHLMDYVEVNVKNVAPTPEGIKRIKDSWQVKYAEADKEYQEKLKGTIATADFIRKELLQRIPAREITPKDKIQEQQFALAANSPMKLNRDDAASYLEELAKRVPAPK